MRVFITEKVNLITSTENIKLGSTTEKHSINLKISYHEQVSKNTSSGFKLYGKKYYQY
jgi:hypothetical protein